MINESRLERLEEELAAELEQERKVKEREERIARRKVQKTWDALRATIYERTDGLILIPGDAEIPKFIAYASDSGYLDIPLRRSTLRINCSRAEDTWYPSLYEFKGIKSRTLRALIKANLISARKDG